LYIFHLAVLGDVYRQLGSGEGKASLGMLARNVGFLLRTIPVAGRRAEQYLTQAVEGAERIGARGFGAMTHVSLGKLAVTRKQPGKARGHFLSALALQEQCGAATLAKETRAALAQLEGR